METPIFDFFENVRSGEYGNSDIYKFLAKYSNNFEIELLHILLYDLSLYLFTEKDIIESEFSSFDKEEILKKYKDENFEIPYFKVDKEKLTERQKENREKSKKKGLDLDLLPPSIDWEKLLYPFEFFSLYQLEYLIKNKINEINGNPNPMIVIPESIETPADKDAKVKFILLKEIGIIDFLSKDKNLNNSDIAKILKPITGIPESYTKNILTADLYNPDPISDKSAYKKKNIHKALYELDNMGITLEQCRYLPTLKINNPELFN